MNTKDFLNYMGYPFNHEPCFQLLFSLFILCCIASYTISDFIRHLLLMINGIYLIYILKHKIKSQRPIDCNTTTLKYCPLSYDIPSGHSFIAIYWILVLLKKQIPYTLPLIVYLGMIPFTRYLTEFHSPKAVFLGSVLGVVWFLLLSVLSGNVF